MAEENDDDLQALYAGCNDRTVIRVHELREGRGSRSGLPVPNSPYSLYGCTATLNRWSHTGYAKSSFTVLKGGQLTFMMVSPCEKQQLAMA